MDMRRLVIGAGVLLIVAGLVLACFTPGGWFNRGTTETLALPFGSISFSAEKRSSWPTLGYVLLGTGGVVLVIAFAMKSRPPY
jgi:hypothetical protein